MKDFKIKGTELPTIPAGTEFRVVDWYDGNGFTSSDKLEFVSYGSRQYGCEDYILAETSTYNEGRYYMFKLKDIERLAEKQSLMEQSELTSKKENMNKVNKSDLGRIHNVACSTWKSKLKTYAQRNPFGDSIELSDSEIDEMFAAATSSQVPVLVSILGERKEQIDFNRIKTGSKVMITCTGQHCNGITGIDLDEPVDVVFYNTQHFINEDEYFHKEGSHSSYTTLHQGSKFVLFSSERGIDFITKVIEY
jgi:hypothetical protein